MSRNVDIMDKEAMQEASRAFKQGGEGLKEIQGAINKIANSLEQEIFQGEAGASFGNALRQDLMRALQSLEAHLTEVSTDLTDALQKRVDAEQQSSGLFQS